MSRLVEYAPLLSKKDASILKSTSVKKITKIGSTNLLNKEKGVCVSLMIQTEALKTEWNRTAKSNVL